MIFSSKFPLRISLAGGGTDLEPYLSDCGGQVVNFGINKFIQIRIMDNVNLQNSVLIKNINTGKEIEVTLANLQISEDHNFRIPLACLLSFHMKFPSLHMCGFTIEYESDVKMGSGLGGSSILAAGIISTLNKKYNTGLPESDVVRISKFAESNLLNLKGGLQDYWSACNSNLKSLVFSKDGKTIINEIPINNEVKTHLTRSLVMLNTNVSRISGEIIEDQMRNMRQSKKNSYVYLDKLKFSAKRCEELLTEGRNLDEIGNILNISWDNKKKLSSKASIVEIETLRSNLLQLGASGAKICGAGGGGFLLVSLKTNRNLEGLFSYFNKFDLSWEYIDFNFNGPQFSFRNV